MSIFRCDAENTIWDSIDYREDARMIGLYAEEFWTISDDAIFKPGDKMSDFNIRPRFTHNSESTNITIKGSLSCIP